MKTTILFTAILFLAACSHDAAPRAGDMLGVSPPHEGAPCVASGKCK